MTITGGCLCGAVRFEADAPPLLVAFCHCGSCRRHTGAPVAVFCGFQAGRCPFCRRRADAICVFTGRQAGLLRRLRINADL